MPTAAQARPRSDIGPSQDAPHEGQAYEIPVYGLGRVRAVLRRVKTIVRGRPFDGLVLICDAGVFEFDPTLARRCR